VWGHEAHVLTLTTKSVLALKTSRGPGSIGPGAAVP
jgi:hypothetical protein